MGTNSVPFIFFTHLHSAIATAPLLFSDGIFNRTGNSFCSPC